MKIQYRVKQDLSGIEAIDVHSPEYVFDDKRIALDFCLNKLREDKDNAARDFEIKNLRFKEFLSEYTEEL